ncbi:MAG: hypothetical protein INR65_11550 [Gluconacetobacter diazotrophicus]|nr:hypothetical protein [Gluconacetobacter diazotrophicus]
MNEAIRQVLGEITLDRMEVPRRMEGMAERRKPPPGTVQNETSRLPSSLAAE